MEIDAELIAEVAAHAGVDTTLSVEKTLSVGSWKDAFVPNIGMNIKSAAAIAPECYDILQLQIIAG